jgi:hypothetical protein
VPAASDLAVIYLVWAPLGPALVEQFLAAYGRYPAGSQHRLVIVLNGFRGPTDRRLVAVDRLLEGFDNERVVPPRPVRDLAAYRLAAEQLEARELCFLNSYSAPLLDGWLSKLATPLSRPAVGMTGTGGSYESAYSSAPFFLRPRRRADFPPFPNPHLRSNGFMIGRELLLELELPAPASKASAWALESGRRSISRQVWDRGLEVLVVGRDGVAYPPERWRESATLRSDGQRNLLIADNRTRQYEQAGPRRRRALEVMAWGSGSQPDIAEAALRAIRGELTASGGPSGA